MPLVEYESLRFCQEGVVLSIEGKSKRIIFTGGTPGKNFRGGRYCTSDEKIQKALEARTDFSNRFKVVFRDLTDKEATRKAEADLQALKDLIQPKPAPVVTEVPSVPEITPPEEPADSELLDVNNAQKAKEYLIRHIDGLTFRQVANKSMILEVASRHNIIFPNWQ